MMSKLLLRIKKRTMKKMMVGILLIQMERTEMIKRKL